MYYIKMDLRDTVETGYKVLKISAILLILYAVMLVVLRECFLCHFRERVNETKSLFELISCRSVVSEDKLRG